MSPCVLILIFLNLFFALIGIKAFEVVIVLFFLLLFDHEHLIVGIFVVRSLSVAAPDVRWQRLLVRRVLIVRKPRLAQNELLQRLLVVVLREHNLVVLFELGFFCYYSPCHVN